MSSPRPEMAEIHRAVSILLAPDCIAELRVPKAGRAGTISGYFDNPVQLIQAAMNANGKGPGVYLTLNPPKQALLARADNRLKSRAEQTTSDADITARRWLLIDCDAKRPAAISTNKEEHEAALERARKIRAALTAEGWPEPVFADSGNGAHLLFRLPDLANSPESTELVKRCLQALAASFDDELVQIDQGVFNASRISKICGTAACKGDSTVDRPHRLARILESPTLIEAVNGEMLKRLAASAPEPQAHAETQSKPNGSYPNNFDIEQWMAERWLTCKRGPVPHEGGLKWVLDSCPFNPEHLAPDSAIFRFPSGALGFKCLHASCASHDWKALRNLLQPGCAQHTDKSNGNGQSKPTQNPR